MRSQWTTDTEVLRAMYEGESRSVSEIAGVFGISTMTAYRALLRAGIKTRKRGVAAGPDNANWRGGMTISKDGYVMDRMPNHPRSNPAGYVLRHILVAEKATGRRIALPHVIHHVDGNPLSNRPGNFVVCQDSAYHMQIHYRKRALRESGSANNLKCGICKEWAAPDDPGLSILVAPNGHRRVDHKLCNTKQSLARYHRKKRAGG